MGEGSAHPKTILKLSFGTTKMAAYVNKFYVCLFVTKHVETFTALI